MKSATYKINITIGYPHTDGVVGTVTVWPTGKWQGGPWLYTGSYLTASYRRLRLVVRDIIHTLDYLGADSATGYCDKAGEQWSAWREREGKNETKGE